MTNLTLITSPHLFIDHATTKKLQRFNHATPQP